MNEVKTLYLFEGNEYRGYFDVLEPFELVFHDNGFFLDLSTGDRIRSWLSTRIIPDERADKSECIGAAGFKKGTSDWEVLVKGHCISMNDIVWWSEENNPSWYETGHWYPRLKKQGLLK